MNALVGKLTIGFGAIVPPLVEQLYEQGYTATVGDLERFQKDADAITRLDIAGLLTASRVKEARRALHRRITQHVKPIH